ncbi:MAG: hypothetical protein DI535_27310 [Citrobacter freundii]|nr:MAG: hypothetical protein DI535_27310 [Citrobacter freundii]
MLDHYHLLHTIYSIVKEDPQPEKYACRPRELILRQFQDWSFIWQQLQLLEEEALVTTEQKDTLIIHITSLGLEMAKNGNQFVWE